MAKTENIFVRAKAYQAKHKRTPWAECIQKVKGKGKVSGTKPKKAIGKVTKKVTGASHKRAITDRKNKTAAVRNVTVKVGKAIGAIEQAKTIVRKIDSLELQRKNAKGRDLKDVIQLEINRQHRMLNTLKNRLKSA